jgi:aryl-alcohol dehydrogenase-like predicted oxidoreductase
LSKKASHNRCPDCGGPWRERPVRLRAPWLALSWFGAGACAYFVAGALLGQFLTGLDRTSLPYWQLLLPIVLFYASLRATFGSRQRLVCRSCERPDLDWLYEALAEAGLADSSTVPTGAKAESRRAFLRNAGTLAAATAATAAGAVAYNRRWVPVVRDLVLADVETQASDQLPAWENSKIARYRRLGRTDFMASDISFGSSRIENVDVAKRALERGVNYFDTAPDYARFGSEEVLGEALRGRRHDVFLATKFCTADGHLPDNTPVPEIIRAIEGSLRRLKTDYVDLIHIHSVANTRRLFAENIHEAFERMKEQGKARFLGMSSHAPQLETVANAAIDSGRFDVLMLAYHHGMWPQHAAIVDRAHDKDVGVVAMKTLKGAKHTNLERFHDERSSYSQAAFRWVLSNPSVSCLVVSFSTFEQCDEYIHASGTELTPRDVALLDEYDRLTAGDYCRPHCGECLDSCPESLPINDILRYRMYFKDYGWEKEGMRLYASLERGGEACLGCNAPCAGTCPSDIPIRTKMLESDRLLRMDRGGIT